jgi:hypothetical protein
VDKEISFEETSAFVRLNWDSITAEELHQKKFRYMAVIHAVIRKPMI